MTGRVAAGPVQQSAPAWPALRVVAWALIGLGIIGFIVAGGARTAWLVGDTLPVGDEVALPRVATISALLGFALLAWHQIRERRSLSPERYRGPSLLIVLALSVALSVAVTLPVREAVNLLYTGGIPDWPPLFIWFAGSQIAILLVAWLAVFRVRALDGFRPFADGTPIRHAAIGILAGAAIWVCGVAIQAVGFLLTTGRVPPLLDAAGDLLVMPPSIPPVIGGVILVALTPVAEEVFLRGAVLEAWRREYGVRFALIGSSLLFGLIHFGLSPLETLPTAVPGLLVLAGFGLVFGVLAIRTGSLIAPIAAHAALNAIPFAISVVVSG